MTAPGCRPSRPCPLLFQALSDELARFQVDQAPTAEQYPFLAPLVGKPGAVDLQRAAQLMAERRDRLLQRAAAVEAVRLETLEDLEAAQSQDDRRRASAPRLRPGNQRL